MADMGAIVATWAERFGSHPDGSGLLVQDEVARVMRLQYFRLPPARYWSWLGQRALAPPLVLSGLLWMRSRWRKRKA